jgi:hypothetical protein
MALVALLAVVGVLFWFGGPQRPTENAAGGVETAAGTLPSGMMSGGEAPEGGVEMPLIPIPGCKCHSDDPVVVEEHSRYSLSDCAECH